MFGSVIYHDISRLGMMSTFISFVFFIVGLLSLKNGKVNTINIKLI